MGYHPHIFIDVGDNAPKKETPAIKQRIQELIETRKQLEFRLKKIQVRIKKYYNLYHKKIPFYRIRIKILLSARNIRTKRSNTKLDYKFLKPFRIMKVVEKQIYRLKFFPTYSRIYYIFYISLLEFYYNRKNRISTTPEPIPIENQNE
jgi:hypothetical protein